MRPREASGANAWTTFSTGRGQVAAGGRLGLFDPTLLLNGIYELRVKATDFLGREGVSTAVAVVVRGELKIGHLRLTSDDVSVAAPGMPLCAVRVYDSRQSGSGDFGREKAGRVI